MTLALALRGPEFTTMDVVRHDWALARDVGARITVHVGVAAYGFSGGVKRMYEEGMLGPDTTYVHCCTLSDERYFSVNALWSTNVRSTVGASREKICSRYAMC